MKQHKGPLPTELQLGEETGYATTLDGSTYRFAFERDRLTVVFEAEALSIEELIALAESMELMN